MSKSVKFFKVILILLIVIIYNASPAFAFKHMKGKEALDYVGDIKTKFTNGKYTYEVLKRTHRDSMNGRFSDAVIFNPQGDRIHYIKRRNGDHDMILNHPDGRVEDPATAETLIWNALQNTLDDDHPHPHVFFDDEGNEMAVVYIGRKTHLKGKLTSNDLLRLRITVKQVKYGKRSR